MKNNKLLGYINGFWYIFLIHFLHTFDLQRCCEMLWKMWNPFRHTDHRKSSHTSLYFVLPLVLSSPSGLNCSRLRTCLCFYHLTPLWRWDCKRFTLKQHVGHNLPLLLLLKSLFSDGCVHVCVGCFFFHREQSESLRSVRSDTFPGSVHRLAVGPTALLSRS